MPSSCACKGTQGQRRLRWGNISESPAMVGQGAANATNDG